MLNVGDLSDEKLLAALDSATKALDNAGCPKENRILRIGIFGHFYEFSGDGVTEYTDGTFTEIV